MPGLLMRCGGAAPLLLLLSSCCCLSSSAQFHPANGSDLSQSQFDWLRQVTRQTGGGPPTAWPGTSPSQAAALDAKAAAHQAVFLKWNLREGQAVDAQFAGGRGQPLDPSTAVLTGITDLGDSACWTGNLLASNAFQYKYRPTADALASINSTVGVLWRMATASSKKGYLTRYVGKSDDALYNKYTRNCSTDNGMCNPSPTFPGYSFLSKESRDQYIGVLFGLSAAYAVLDGANATGLLAKQQQQQQQQAAVAVVKQAVVELSELLIDTLAGDDWFILAPKDIKKQIPVNPTPSMIAAFQAHAIRINPGKYNTAGKWFKHSFPRWWYTSEHTGEYAPSVPAWGDSYFSNNLMAMTLFTTAVSEVNDADRRHSLGGRLADLGEGKYANQLQATFQSYYLAAEMLNPWTTNSAAGTGTGAAAAAAPNPTAAAILVATLLDFVQAPKWNRAVNLTDDAASQPLHDSLHAEYAIFPSVRQFDTYMWQRSPTQLAGGGDDATVYQSTDFLQPYWIAKCTGVL